MRLEFLHNLSPKIANTTFNILVVMWTLVYGFIALPLVLILPHNLLIEVRKPWINVILFLLRILFGISFEVRGMEYLNGLDGFIVAAKHHSPLDVLLIANIFTKPAFVLKKSLLYLPIFGFYMLATKMITVSYSSDSSALFRLRKMLKQARILNKDGRTIVVYPEGSRVSIGQKIGYKGGVFAFYKDLGLPVIPVALNAGSVWPMGYFDSKKPGNVIIQILKPIKVGLSKNEFLESLESVIENQSNAMLRYDGHCYETNG